jgi:probable HAF family extracellular repeat protein
MNRFCRGATALLLLSGSCAYAQFDGLVINELLPNPRNSSGVYLDSNQDGVTNVFDDEFIELMNTSTNTIDVAGLWLTDANTNIQRHVFSSRILPPGGSLVVFGGGTLLNFSNPPAQIATGGGLSLNNNQSETVTLFSSPTTQVDQVSYLLTASHDAISLVRDPDGTGALTNHYKATTNLLRSSPGRQIHGGAFLTNQPPVLLDLADQTAFVGLELDVPVRAYDPADGDPITLSVVNNPSNSMLSSTGGVGTFTFTPTEDQAGLDLQLLFIAGDVDGAETNIVSFQIINPNADEDIWINEIHYNNISDDVDEGVEIAGTAGSVLSEYSLILYNGLNGNTYNSNALTGTLDDEQCGFGATWIGYPPNGLQNETEGIALVKGTNVLQFLSYDGVITASNGPAQGMTSLDIGVKETVTTPLGDSLQLEGTGTVYSAFAWTNAQPHSRGTLNSNQTIVCLSPPAIEIQKTVYLGHDGGTGGPGVESVQGTNGAALTYLFRVSNTGGTSLTNVMILDAALGMPPISLGTLVTGQISTSYVEAVLSGDLRNTATVSGEDPDGLSVLDQDTAEVVELIPSIDIQKTVYRGHDGGASCPGSDFLQATNGTPVTYCFVVENNGNTNLNSLTLTDDPLGISTIIGTLEAGGTFSTSVEAVVTGSLTNTAIVDGIDPNTDPVSDQDSTIVIEIHPALQLEKTVYLGHDSGASFPGSEQVSGDSGTAITYCFLVSNAGDTPLTNVILSDAGLSGFPDQDLGTLITGETASLYYETALTASFINTATSTAFSVIGSLVTDADSAEVELTTPVVTNWNLEYEVIDLGTLGGAASEAFGINDRGQVVGASMDTNGMTQAFEWHNGSMTGLGFLPGGTSSVAKAINRYGLITGQAHVPPTTANYQHAFLYASNTLVDLGTLGGSNSYGRAINNWGDITGSSWLITNAPNAQQPEAFVWRSNQYIHIPPWFGNDWSCDGWGINDDGWIVGNSFLNTPNPRWWAYVWYDWNGNFENDVGDMVVLGALGPKDSAGEYSCAFDINDRGQAVGWTGITNAFYPHHAFLVTSSNGVWKTPALADGINPTNTLMQDLGALETPDNNSYANAINNESWIVGTSSSTSGVNQAFLWRDGIMTNLNDLIAANSPWVLTNATGVNDLGEICGTGLYEGQKHAFVLRAGGRISRIESLLVTNGLQITTNEFLVVETQQLWRVDTQVIEWVGTWGTNSTAPSLFTVEYCEPLQDHTWAPFPPTNQWPITETFWTNTVFTNRMRFFRIHAVEIAP